MSTEIEISISLPSFALPTSQGSQMKPENLKLTYSVSIKTFPFSTFGKEGGNGNIKWTEYLFTK